MAPTTWKTDRSPVGIFGLALANLENCTVPLPHERPQAEKVHDVCA
jgi:hypothetical protein